MPKRRGRRRASSVPVVVQRGVDVDRDAHEWRRSGGPRLSWSHGCRPPKGAGRGPAPTGRRALGLAGRRLARAPALGDASSGRCGERRSTSARARPMRLHPRPRGLVAELARATSRLRPRPPRRSPSTCPASARRRCPREKISIPGYGRYVDALLRRARRRAGARRRQLDGRLHRRGARDPVPGARRAPGARERGGADASSAMRNERVLAALRRPSGCSPAYGGWIGARSETLARRPRARQLLFNVVAAHPDRLPAPLVAEQVRGLGQARLHRRARRADRLPDPRPPRRDRVPDADRLGRPTTGWSRCATPTSSSG